MISDLTIPEYQPFNNHIIAGDCATRV